MKNRISANIVALAIAFALMSCEAIAATLAEMRQYYNGEWSYPQDSLASNVYVQTKHIYEDSWTSPFDYFLAVRNGRLELDLSAEDVPKFYALRDVVSNNCAQIAADWQTYETNEMVRFTTLCAVVHSGFDNYTNFTDSVVSKYEASTNSCNFGTLHFLRYPRNTDAAYTLIQNYDNPVVSNAVLRMRTLAEALCNTNEIMSCNYFLSGEAKTRYLTLKADGQL